MAYIIPSDAHVIADTGHTTDHNNMADMLTGISWLPSDNGLLGCNFPLPAITTETSQMIAGTIYLSKLVMHQSLTIAYLWWLIGQAGTGASSGSFAGLYDNSGTRLAVTADIGTNLTNYTNKQHLTSSVTVTAGSTYWAAIVSNLASTQPKLSAGFNADPGIATLNQAAGPDPGAFACAVNGTGQTSLPSTLTLASNTTTGAFPFFTAYNLLG